MSSFFCNSPESRPSTNTIWLRLRSPGNASSSIRPPATLGIDAGKYSKSPSYAICFQDGAAAANKIAATTHAIRIQCQFRITASDHRYERDRCILDAEFRVGKVMGKVIPMCRGY